MKQRLNALIAEYGSMAIVVYFVIFFGTLSGFAAAITWGMEIEGTAGTLGLWGAAWLATKATQPLRLGATLALTPVAAAVWHRTPWGRRRLEARRAAAREEAAALQAEATGDPAPSESGASVNDGGA